MNAPRARERLIQIVNRTPEQFGVLRSRWRLVDLRQTCTWLRVTSLAGLWQVLQRLGLHYKRARDYLHSPDAHYSEKLEHIDKCLQASRNDPQHYPFLYLDEFTFYRQPSLAMAYAVSGSKEPLAHRSLRSNTAHRVLGALNAVTGRVHYHMGSKTSLKTFHDFYAELCAAYPEATCIYVAQDNWPVHAHPYILSHLAKQEFPWWPILPTSWSALRPVATPNEPLPIQLLFLPTYAPWTNPIEKLWRWLKQDRLHLHHLSDDWTQLKQSVASFLDQFSQGSTELLHYVGLLPD